MNEIKLKEIARDARHKIADILPEEWDGHVDYLANQVLMVAIREAVQATYEDAAQLVERYNIVGSNINWADKQVAAAIRNRAKEVTQ